MTMKTFAMWDRGTCELELVLDDNKYYQGAVRVPGKAGEMFFSYGYAAFDEMYEFLCKAFLEGALFPKDVLTTLKADREERDNNDRA